ncbi:hypothetical protein LMG19083_00060 [Ralstonia psammae]|uniref:PilX/PilW C-terminal domain-containing protein n=1 Tax=Ralstonia psammae TaxID=3058598 RepID=A0ABN9IBH9_9RALS|nr:pilus assembly protein PilZ [Ralstonia sp. LMG 19083]CAJ0775660.1 hypothetical protein LMG19083_00060 [Ralstonia sp. LMG 19083]
MLNPHMRDGGFSIISVAGALIIMSLLMAAALHLVLDHRRRASLFADHALAQQEAEAALAAAECRIAVATGTPRRESCDATLDAEEMAALDPSTLAGFVPGRCGTGMTRGLCWPLQEQPAQSLSRLLADEPDAATLSPTVQTGARQPALPARYVIEPIPDGLSGHWVHAGSAHAPSLFRITAVGFGTDREINVMLQTVYRPQVGGP